MNLSLVYFCLFFLVSLAFSVNDVKRPPTRPRFGSNPAGSKISPNLAFNNNGFGTLTEVFTDADIVIIDFSNGYGDIRKQFASNATILINNATMEDPSLLNITSLTLDYALRDIIPNAKVSIIIRCSYNDLESTKFQKLTTDILPHYDGLQHIMHRLVFQIIKSPNTPADFPRIFTASSISSKSKQVFSNILEPLSLPIPDNEDDGSQFGSVMRELSESVKVDNAVRKFREQVSIGPGEKFSIYVSEQGKALWIKRKSITDTSPRNAKAEPTTSSLDSKEKESVNEVEAEVEKETVSSVKKERTLVAKQEKTGVSAGNTLLIVVSGIALTMTVLSIVLCIRRILKSRAKK